MAYGVDRYPNPPAYWDEVARIYYEIEDGVLVRCREKDEEGENGECDEARDNPRSR